jgi:hypothetical protein
MITMTKPPSEAIVSKDKKIDLTQFEENIETANAYMESWFKGTVTPMNGKKWRNIKDLGLHVDWSHNEVFGPLVEEFPALIAELKRCYDLIDKMQHSIVKNRGDCWDCDMPIDSCDARYCERQMLEDIELGTASE